MSLVIGKMRRGARAAPDPNEPFSTWRPANMGRSPAKGHEFSILEQKLVRDGSTFVDDNLRMYAATPRVLFDAACIDLTSPERYTRQRAFKTLQQLASEGRHELTSEARFICAECHLYGRGVLKDIVTAQRWFSTCCVGAAAMAFPDDQVSHCSYLISLLDPRYDPTRI